MLELKNVHASYGRKIRALQGVSLKVGAGEIVCLIGANGAGKSSLLHAASGLLAPDEGEILFQGRRVDGQPAHCVTELGLVQVPEGRRIFPRMTVLENLEMGAYLRSDHAEIRRDMDKAFELFPLLRDRRQQAGGTLSGGEQQMLAIGRGLMSRPKMLLLDEPSMGLAPLIVRKILETVVRINKDGIPILLVEQNARQALAVSHRGYVMETGRIVLEGAAAKLLEDPQVRKAYLGIN
jgi:branched-chain amino acid transport system ATP-binding protein